VLVLEKRILSVGFNGFPQNLSDSLELYEDREYKLAVTVHAESNAILNAAKNGAKTQSCTAYVTFPPCSQCAAALIQAGVTTPLVTLEVNRNPVLACDQSDSRSGRNSVVMTVVNRVLGVMMT
jgi:dCMP deaminase